MEGFDRFVNEYFPSELKYLGLKNHMHQSELLTDFTHNISVDDQMMLYDQQTYMIDDILQKVDRATMSVSLEGREPFLDHKLIEFTSRIPVDLKYKDGKDKYLLREVLYKHVPKEMIERPKMGFGIPLKDWFQGDLKSFYQHYMNEDYLRKDGTFDAKRMSQLSEWFLEDRLDKYDYKMWFVFSFLQWKDYWKID
jgi:asparagine synthase (glutamine-hydrolysing)